MVNEAVELAALEVEIAAEEAAAAKLSAEEALVLETMDLPATQVVEEVVEEVIGDEDDIWKVAEPVGGGPQVRFAEDIIGAPVQGRRGGPPRRRRGGRTQNRRPPGAGGRGPNSRPPGAAPPDTRDTSGATTTTTETDD